MARNREAPYASTSKISAAQDPLLAQPVCNAWREHIDRLRCPRCLGSMNVTEGQDGLVCVACGQVWSVVGGLPILANSDRHYHAQVPESLMRKLLADISNLGWLRALYQLLHDLPPSRADALCRDVLHPNRALGLSLLPSQADLQVLDLGAGWGSLSIPLAKAGAAVTAVDLAPLRARFAQLRAREDRLSNLFVLVGGDTPFLPFAECQFDAAILNGVLEWVTVSRDGAPRDIQVKYLREVRRVLKRDGLLYVGIENRLSHQYLRGSLEDHVELRYVTLLPRWLADRWAEHQIGVPYRTHTHTLHGYRRLLQDAGFGRARFYYPHPNYRRPAKIIPLDRRLSLRFWSQMGSGGPLRRFLVGIGAWSGLLRLLAHSYIVLAREREGQRA